MSGPNGPDERRPSLRLIDGGRSSGGSSAISGAQGTDHQRLAEIIARGSAASSELFDDEAFDPEEVLDQLQAAAERSKHRKVDPLDPLRRHAEARPGERVEGDRGGPSQPVANVFKGVLDVPKLEVGVLPSSKPSDSRPVTSAVSSPQVAKSSRNRKRDERRKKRRAYDKKRLDEVRETIFRSKGQEPDIPDMPPLHMAVKGMNLRVMQDGTGRKACELAAKLPLGQQMEVYQLGYAALPFVRARRPSAFTREDLAKAEKLPEGRDELAKALDLVRTEVAPTEWYRRIVCAAWAMWSHRGKPLSEAARKAARGGVYMIEGFCQNALSSLVPRADGGSWSRTVLWGPTGPFTLLGAAARQLGREVDGEAGAGLFTRWQQPAGVAKFKGPTKKNPKTGKLERFAVAVTRYDAPMAGRTASSLARRARGAVRELARTVMAAMTPWVKLPEPRSRKTHGRVEAANPDQPEAAPAEPPARTPP